MQVGFFFYLNTQKLSNDIAHRSFYTFNVQGIYTVYSVHFKLNQQWTVRAIYYNSSLSSMDIVLYLCQYHSYHYLQ